MMQMVAGPSGVSSVERAKIFLVGFYGMDNLGDDAILDSIERAGDMLGVEISHYAVRTEPAGDLRAVRLRGSGWRAYLRAIWDADRIVIGGGGLLKDEGIKRWQGYGLLLELFGTAALARLLGKSVALIGMGVGPIYTKLGAWLIAPIARLAGCRVVRDQASADALERLGVRDVEICADPAFSMRDAMISKNGQAESRQWPPRRMLISARRWYLMAPDGAERWPQLVAAIAKMADEAIEDGLKVEFACLYWPQDRAVAEEITTAMCHGEQVRIPVTANDWWGLAGDLRRSDVLVSMRYHAVVCATMVRTPVFALAYEPKVSSLAQDIGIPMIDVNDRTQVESIPAEVRAFREANTSVPPLAIVDAAMERMSASAWQGLSKALTV
jgi:polysaccharide pyruvyl transferase CsaB